MNWRFRSEGRALPCARPGVAGFTLLEVVLALSVFALLGTILYGAFALSHNAVAKSQTAAARNQVQRSSADLLASYIRSVYPYRTSPQDQTVFFEGESDSVTFVSAYSQGMGGRGLAKIHIAAEADEDAGAPLQLEEVTPVRLGDNDLAEGYAYRLVLHDRASNFRLAYLDPQDDSATWHERWDGEERRMLPRALRLTFVDRNGQEVRWIFPVMMAVLAP